MSNVGQAALIVVGTVVGAYFGNPQLGFVLGSLAGSALFPTQLPAGPRITDNRTTTATVGQPVPIVFGTADVAGTVIWLAPYVEHSSGGGKGGPTQETFNYTQSIAIGLCERVDDNADPTIGAIAGLSRVWENGAIVYDIRPQQQANTFLNTVAETDLQYENRLIASAAYAETFTLHLGTETQTADPTIEAIEGVSNVPAFRGMAYIVYPNRQLSTAQGLRHPNFTFEVYQAGIGDCVDTTQYSNEVLYPWFDDRNLYTYTLRGLDTTIRPVHGSSPLDLVFNSITDLTAAAETYLGLNQSVRISYSVPVSSASSTVVTVVPLAGSVEIGVTIDGKIVDPQAIIEVYNYTTPRNGIAEPQPPPGEGASLYATPGNLFYQTVPSGGGNFALTFVTAIPDADIFAYPPWDPPFSSGSRWTGFFWFESVGGLLVSRLRLPGPPPPPCAGLVPSAANPGYAVDDAGRLVKCTDWIKDSTQTYRVLQKFAAAGDPTITPNYQTKHPLNPCVPVSDTTNYDNETFWVTAYTAAVSEGKIAGGLTYGTDYPQVQSYGYVLDSIICEGSGFGVSVSSIIAAVCSRAGMTQYDVSDLTSQTIPGYSISSICDAADIISPLRSVAFFDCVESGESLKFVSRGKEVVATLTADDFGCFDGGTTGNSGGSQTGVPPAITTARADETTLPRSIRLHYKAVSRDYQDAEADSPFRKTASAVDDQDISIPLVLADVQAVQAAEIIWADAWAAQNSHELSVDQSMAALEPGDCIGVPIDGVIERLRIVSDSNAAGILRKLACVRDNQGSYISFAVAAPPEHVPSQLVFLAPSSMELLDLPALQDADNDPGFYVATQRLDGQGNSWKGATVYKSVDGGATFTTLFTLTTEATIGNLIGAVQASAPYTWDDLTVIDVAVASAAFTFESRTDAAVLAGANAAAVGDNGRWEIIQFANATKISDTHWQLSRLLRGRRGTEHNIGRSHINDRFVMISTGDLVRIPLQTAEIGADRVYKVVSVGSAFSSGIDQTFAGHAQALVPFSPVDLVAERQSGADILISWIRRGRLGRTLMSGVDVPLSEASEAYQVDILDPSSPDSPEVVKRTIAVTAQHAIYTAAMQTADFGSTTATQVKVAIYQMSATVGRGTPAIETLTIG